MTPGGNPKSQIPVPGLARQIRHGHAILDPASQQRLQLGNPSRRQSITAKNPGYQPPCFVPGVVGTVAE